METILIVIFVIGYLAIALEHKLKIDKLIPALAMMVILWSIIAVAHLDVYDINTITKSLDSHDLESVLLHHLGKTAEILVFLLGAMVIVEIIDYFDGFSTIKTYVKTKQKVNLLWLFTTLGFLLSAIIDNLTATIVLITIVQKIVHDRELRLWYAGLIVIATNAGGAWSPIGDVTTTMLWIAKKTTPSGLMIHVLLPAIICYAVPVLIASRLSIFKGSIETSILFEEKSKSKFNIVMFYLGLTGILFVPIFKTFTHLPPYMGMMLSFAIVSIFAEYFNSSKFKNHEATNSNDIAQKSKSPLQYSLSKIELPSILFFLGILMAVAALESVGMLFEFAGVLEKSVPLLGTELHSTHISDLVVLFLGIGSAIIDNVPLVAASIGMFSIPIDEPAWHFIAYSAGTGGSLLIIGSAAGVVAMGMEKMDFFWYLKKISWLALTGFLSGFAVFVLLRDFLLNHT
ncbi:MAG TPA: sodium:proton antiporter [Flavobacterium sp.]|nr:sodium:proton antiporter [Flavobacterium sp.]